MTSIGRLSDKDVRAIFESLHENTPPPSHLKFQIVPVGPEGLKLSPPAYKFDSGLYVLLRPEKKNAKKSHLIHVKAERPRAPDHVKHLVMKEIPEGGVSWSLSGPQFPKPTAIQQRYCYPKGDEAYCSQKGGALWTIYNHLGKEDHEFRILHVYYSAKRSANRSTSSTGGSSSLSVASSSAAKSTPRKGKATTGRKAYQRKAPASFRAAVNLQGRMDRPVRDIMRRAVCVPRTEAGRSTSPIAEIQDSIDVNKRAPKFTLVSPETNRPNPDGEILSHQESIPYMSEQSGLLEDTMFGFGRSGRMMDLGIPIAEFHSQDEADFGPQGLDFFHNIDDDPVLSIIAKPSVEYDARRSSFSLGISSPEIKPNVLLDADSLTDHLLHFQKQLKDDILRSSPAQAGLLTSVVASWARNVADSPLDVHPERQEDNKQGKPKIERIAQI